MAKTRRRRNVHRRRTKKHHRRRKTKRRVKRRRKTTRKKRGRGMGPSKMAKGAVAALAASTAMGQGMGHGISPSRGTAAAVNHFKTVACSDFHIGDIVEHSEDHGQTTKHYRPVLQAALGKKKSCKRMGQPMRKPKPEKIKKNPNESGRQFKKRKREEKRQAKAAKAEAEQAKAAKAEAEQAKAEAEQQQEIEEEVVREMESERNKGSKGMSGAEMAAYGAAATVAGLAARELRRGRQRVRNTRIVRRVDGRREVVRINDGSTVRELTPERQRR